MNINLTLIGQMIAFLIFVGFCMKYVWPPIVTAMAERQKRIAEGLDAADRAARELETAKSQIADELKVAREQVADLLEKANKRSAAIVEEAQEKARAEAERILASAQAQIAQDAEQARESLRAEVSKLAVFGAERILKSTIDESKHKQMLVELAEEL